MLNIQDIRYSELKIPFIRTFSHGSADRNETETVIVQIIDASGLIGYGEGCPRSYVTGESIETAFRFLKEHRTRIFDMKTLDDIKSYLAEYQTEIDQNPAGWCAMELALLDLLGKENQQSVESVLSLPKLLGTFQYTAVVGVERLDACIKQLQRYFHVGFKDYKIKVSGDLEEDRKKIDAFRELNSEIRVRLDANNLWENAKQAVTYIGALNYPFFAVEEPLKPDDYAGLQEIYETLGVPIILDESFLRLEHFTHITSNPKTWMINLRISKMGGIIRSLTIAEKAKTLGIPLIIGAQVGESSILTRAALTVANTCRDILIAQEGAFGTHLLERDITEKSIMFGKGGRLDAPQNVTQYGFGVDCDL